MRRDAISGAYYVSRWGGGSACLSLSPSPSEPAFAPPDRLLRPTILSPIPHRTPERPRQWALGRALPRHPSGLSSVPWPPGLFLQLP